MVAAKKKATATAAVKKKTTATAKKKTGSTPKKPTAKKVTTAAAKKKTATPAKKKTTATTAKKTTAAAKKKPAAAATKKAPVAPKKKPAAAKKKPAAARTTIAAKKHEAQRSPEWEKFRDAFLAKNPKCACCGKTTGLQAHHVFPFHYGKKLDRPDLELNNANLITLCETEKGKPSENHHLLVGHLDDFESSNLDVRADADVYKNKTADQIKADAAWQAKKKNRLPHLEKMTADEKAAFKWAMQETYPVSGASFPKPTTKFAWLPKYLLAKL